MMKNKKINYLFAHGAGAPSTSEWMTCVSSLIEKRSLGEIKVTRFNFPFMEKRLMENKKFPPDKMPKLIEEWIRQIENFELNERLFIGGKSMGARACTLIDFPNLNHKILGVINFGFPFHAPGKEPGNRITHLEKFSIKCLINQGERDPMGSREEITQYLLSKKIKFNYLADGDHDLMPRKKSGLTLERNLINAVDCAIEFMRENVQ